MNKINLSIDFIIVIIYLISTLFVGFYRNKKLINIKDYAVSDRNFSTPILIASIFATFIGAGSTAGLVEKVYENGIIFIFIFLGIPVSKFIIARFIIDKMHRFFGMISPGDIMEVSYGKIGKIATGFANAVVSIGDIGIQVIAIGKLFEIFLGVPIGVGSIIGSGIVIAYSAFGGIRSVTATDVLQFIVLIISIPIIANLALVELGGYEKLIMMLPKTHIEIVDENHFTFVLISMFIVKCLPFEMPAMIQRVLMAKDHHQIKQAMYLTSFIDLPFILIIGIIGLASVILLPSIDSTNALYTLMLDILPTGLKGFAVAGMLAVIMSTSDSILNNASISIVHDLIKPFMPKLSSKHELLYARAVTIILGASSIIIALNFSSVFDIWTKFYGVWVATIIVPFIFTIYNINISVRSFIICGFIAIISFFGWNHFLAKEFGVGGLFPSLVVSFLMFLFFSFHEKIIQARLFAVIINLKKEIILQILNLQRKILNIEFNSSIFATYSSNRVKIFGAQYVAFGSFAVFNYLVPYFMWYDSFSSHDTSLIYLRTLGGILSSLLIIKDYWSSNLTKFLPLYWHITLTYCLPFLTFYMFLETKLSNIWLVNMTLALFLLSVLVDWLSFIFILAVGLSSGYMFFIIKDNSNIQFLANNSETMYLAIYACVFSISIGLIFSRNVDFFRRRVIDLLEAKVAKKTLSLKEALNSKRDFLNNMSHEIRTPLQGIIGISKELVKQWDDFSDEDRYRYAKKVAENGDRLLGLVSNLLDLSKFDAGKMLLDYEECNLPEFLKKIIEEMQGLTIGRKISLVYKEDPLAPKFAIFDRSRIYQVLINLISNSFRYSKNGQIIVSLNKNEIRDGVEFVKISVSDSGIGVPEDEKLAIFRPFYQSKRTKTNAGGTGLGLAICLEIINAHHGEIWVENNNQSKGCIFNFIIPFKVNLVKNTEDTENTEITKINKISKDRLNILLIDDEESCLISGSLILENQGHNVVTMNNGVQALSLLAKMPKSFDLIMLDLNMGDMQGIEVLEKIKNDKKLNLIPVIIQSGSSDIEEINKAIAMGAIGHVTKPFSKEKIVNLINRIFS